QGHVVRIQAVELRTLVLDRVQHALRQLLRTLAAPCPVIAHVGLDADLRAALAYEIELGRRVRAEAVDGDDDGHAEEARVADVTREVVEALPERLQTLVPEVVGARATMHLERAQGRDDHRAARREPCLATLDVEELLRAQVRAEA